jgi:hypothetical protein
VAIQLFIGKLGCVLGVYLAEGGLDGGPRVLKVDLVAMEALCARLVSSDLGGGVEAKRNSDMNVDIPCVAGGCAACPFLRSWCPKYVACRRRGERGYDWSAACKGAGFM